MRNILLVNPNTSVEVTQLLLAEAQAIAGGRAQISAASPSFGSASLECRAETVVAAHGVLETIATHSGFDAAIIAAFADPGLDAARDISAIPVYGLRESGICAAADGGRPYAIVTLGTSLREDIVQAAAKHAPNGSLVALRFLDVSVLTAARNRDALISAALALANECAEDNGAEAILLGGAPFAGIAKLLGGHSKAPIYDGLQAAIERALAAPRSNSRYAPMAGAQKERPGVSMALAESIDRFLARSSLDE